MSQTSYCYHCGTHHPIEKMRLIVTKGNKRLRCIKSIEAVKVGIAQRDAFGRQISDSNKAAAQSMLRILKPD